MLSHERELLVARICSGSVRVRLGLGDFVFRANGRDDAYAAQEVYAQTLYEAELSGLFTDEELLAYLLECGLWDEPSQQRLESLPKEIDALKLSLFRAVFRSSERRSIRRTLAVARSELSALQQRRRCYDHLACSGAATSARGWYLLGRSLHDSRGRPVFGDDFWEEPSGLLEQAAGELSRCRLGEADYRELARSEPWRTTWSCRRAEQGAFGRPSADFTEEQRSLVAFSCLYDGVWEHPDCPPDEVVEDDDLLDGWLLDQKEKRDARRPQVQPGSLGANADAQEVYLVADTFEDAKQVMALNDAGARATQRMRFEKLKAQGEVSEMQMPDTKARLRMEAARKLSQSMRS